MIGKLFEYFFGSFFISIATYYVAVKITERKFEPFRWNILKWILLETLILMILYIMAPNNLLRVTINAMVISYIYKKLFDISYIKCFLLSFLTFLVIALSEFVFFIINLSLIKSNIKYINDIWYMKLCSNIIISLSMIVIGKLNFISYFYKKITLENDVLIKKSIIFIIICCLLCLSMLFYYMYFKISNFMSILISFFLMTCYTMFAIILLVEKSYSFKLKLEYETILKNMENYEKDLTEQRIKNHENKNILISIKGMLGKNNIELQKFINQILNDSTKDDNDLLYSTKNIPMGGLQGLIYQKLLYMKNHNITYFIHVDKNLKKEFSNKISDGMIKDICMIIGVFIDNAIQEVEGNFKKLVGIKMYNSKETIVLEISNNFIDMIDVDCLDRKGFSNKGKKRGYGLCLVKDIIEKNNNLKNIREIRGDIFIQKLIIKL